MFEDRRTAQRPRHALLPPRIWNRRLALLFHVLVCAQILPRQAAEASPTDRPEVTAAVEKLIAAYPAHVIASPDGQAVVVNGAVMAVDQKRNPTTFEQRLDQADLLDQLSISYPVGCPVRTPTLNEDPGRLRYDPFFAAMYGGTAKAVAKNLTTITWFGQKVTVTKVNGTDLALQAVANDLAALVAKQPELRKYVTPSAGTYNFRTIAGTKRLSMHAYGIGIDLNTAYSDYWRWTGKGTPPSYRNRIPCEIGGVFERHGFIWGAKWYHYDSMHFEYRPELLP